MRLSSSSSSTALVFERPPLPLCLTSESSSPISPSATTATRTPDQLLSLPKKLSSTSRSSSVSPSSSEISRSTRSRSPSPRSQRFRSSLPRFVLPVRSHLVFEARTDTSLFFRLLQILAEKGSGSSSIENLYRKSLLIEPRSTRDPSNPYRV